VDVFLVSRDKDLEQLLSEHVFLFDPMKDEVIDSTGLLEKKGYTPEQAIHVQTLSGDTTDNVPGVTGIGTKTAAKLIAKYGSAEAVLDHADELTPAQSKNVKAFAAQLPITRQLVTLRRDVPMTFNLADCRFDGIAVDRVRPIFSELGFTRLSVTLESFGGAGGGTIATDSPTSNSESPAPSMQPIGEYELVDSVEALDRLADALERQSVFAFDTETTGLNPVAADLVGISVCFETGKASYIPVRAFIGTALPLETVVRKLKPIFENPSIGKVGQNIKFDVVVLRQVGIETKGIAFDTMIASFLLDPGRRSHAMDSLVQSLLDHRMIPITELIGKGRNQITMDQIDTAIVCEYASEDADYTWRLMEFFEPQMSGSHVEPLFRETEMPLVEVLAEMEHNGIALDVPRLKRMGEEMGARLVELTASVHKAAGHAFNVDSTKQLATVLFDEFELPVIKKTKTGRSTDAETLSALVSRTDNPIAKLVLEYREFAKLKSTYVDTLPRMVCTRTGRVHAGFNQTGAITGRLSSRDPNLQNIPIRTETGKQIRAAFIPGSKDQVLLVADYSQVELRLLAHFCKDDALLEAFHTGEDIHEAVAAKVNGIAVGDVTSAQRSAAKAVNFGIIYGQSAFGLSRTLGIPVGEASAFIDAYFKGYPGIRTFIDKCIADAKRNGYAETILGRRRPIPELQSRNRQQVGFGERIAVNTVVQGSAADLIKRAMIDIHRELKTGAFSAKMLVQVHDELVFEVAEERAATEAEMIRDKMAGAIVLDVPVVVDIAWGRNWAEAK
ncbi:MAG: DNA polymerase I, partial [Planctomycetes bacterium]|nr:DNA polymerase I [Planctomycetota bacterium]